MKSVIELEQKAIDSKCDLSDVLLHAYLIASQLGDEKNKNIFYKELDGFMINEPIEWRKIVKKRILFDNVTSEQKRILDSEFDDFYYNIGIEHIIVTLANENSYYTLADYEGNLKKLEKKYEVLKNTSFRIRLTNQEYRRILFNIRKNVLDWAVNLHSKGILGEEGFFNSQEKIFGIQIISGDLIHGDKVLGDLIYDNKQIEFTLEAIERLLPDAIDLPIDNRSVIQDQIAQLKAENEKPNKDHPFIKKAFTVIGQFIQETSNTAVKAYITAMVNKY